MNITMHSSTNTHESFFFLCEPLVDVEKHPGENTEYQHCIICLAEGLTELGYRCLGNTDYWQEDVDSDFLITRHDSLSHHKAIIISSHWILKNNPTQWLQDIPPHTPLFLMADSQEENHKLMRMTYLSRFNKIMLCGYVSSYKYPPNVIPWAFGLSNRIIKESEKHINQHRNDSLLCNFRMEHTARKLAKKFIIPALENHFTITYDFNLEVGASEYDIFMHRQTGHRHYPSYFETLGYTKAFACFGGYFSASISRQRFSLLNRVFSKYIRKFELTSRTLIQHDSWRFWEGLISGCMVLREDLDELHVVYPVSFENFTHYVGIPRKYFNAHNSCSLYNDVFLPHSLDNIGMRGREFVLQHYTPQACAKRFLKLL